MEAYYSERQTRFIIFLAGISWCRDQSFFKCGTHWNWVCVTTNQCLARLWWISRIFWLCLWRAHAVLKLPLPGKKLFSNTKSLHILLKMDFLLQFVHQSKESKHCLSTFPPLNKLDHLSTIFTHVFQRWVDIGCECVIYSCHIDNDIQMTV